MQHTEGRLGSGLDAPDSQDRPYCNTDSTINADAYPTQSPLYQSKGGAGDIAEPAVKMMEKRFAVLPVGMDPERGLQIPSSSPRLYHCP